MLGRSGEVSMTRTRVIRLIALVLAVLCGMLEVLCGHSGGNIA
jgi:hypothetical protein